MFADDSSGLVRVLMTSKVFSNLFIYSVILSSEPRNHFQNLEFWGKEENFKMHARTRDLNAIVTLFLSS